MLRSAQISDCYIIEPQSGFGFDNAKMAVNSVARLPSIITSTVGGSALGEERYLLAVIVFAVTLVISAIGWLIYHFLSERREKKGE